MNENDKLDLVLERLEKLEKKVEDNNSILHGDRNSKRWGKLFWIIKWVVITALGIVAWSYLQPIYQTTTEAAKAAAEGGKKAQDALKSLTDILDTLPKTEDFSLENLKKKLTD